VRCGSSRAASRQPVSFLLSRARFWPPVLGPRAVPLIQSPLPVICCLILTSHAQPLVCVCPIAAVSDAKSSPCSSRCRHPARWFCLSCSFTDCFCRDEILCLRVIALPSRSGFLTGFLFGSVPRIARLDPRSVEVFAAAGEDFGPVISVAVPTHFAQHVFDCGLL
jgi:hypothetical protein